MTWHVSGGSHHSEHVVERLELGVIPQEAAHLSGDPVELGLVPAVHRPGRGESRHGPQIKARNPRRLWVVFQLGFILSLWNINNFFPLLFPIRLLRVGLKD